MKRAPLFAGLAVFLLALGLRLAYVEEQERVLQLDVSRLTQTDNHVFAAWARTIAAGDLLCREQPHAYHHWTELVAPEGRWLEWYGGETTFHQAPLYAYLVAAVLAVAGDEHLYIARAQALLSALTCLLTFLLGLRLVGLRAGILAGLLMVFCGGYVFYDAFILRDGPMAFFVILTALCVEAAARRDRPAAWFLAGASLGLFTLAKETGPALLVITLLGIAWAHRRRPGSAIVRGAALALGFALLLAPAVWRNHEVGAPLTKLSTRGPEVLVAGNARGQDGVGWDPPVSTLRRILAESNFSMARAFLLTLETHRADPLAYLALLGAKTTALFNSYEIPNNVNYYLNRAHLQSLRFGVVGWGLLTPAALLGLLLGLRRWRKLLVPYLLFGAVVASIVLLYVLARFRLQLLPLMAFFAAVGIDGCLTAWQERRRGTVGMCLVVFGLGAWWAAPSGNEHKLYTDENKNMSVMFLLAKMGHFDRAMHFYEAQMAQIGPDDEMASDPRLISIARAFESFRRLDAYPEGSAERHLLLGQAFSDMVPATKRAELVEFRTLAHDHFRAALELAPDLRGAHYGLARLEAIVATHPTRGGSVGDLGPAIVLLREELERHPDHGESHRDLGLLYRGGERSPERWPIALQHLMTAEVLGVVNGELAAAVAVISAAEDMRELPPVRVSGRAVPVFDMERARDAAQRALALSPDHPRVLFDVADVLYIDDRIDEAVELLERLAEIQPWRPDIPNRIRSFRRYQERHLDVAPADEAPPESVEPTETVDGEFP